MCPNLLTSKLCRKHEWTVGNKKGAAWIPCKETCDKRLSCNFEEILEQKTVLPNMYKLSTGATESPEAQLSNLQIWLLIVSQYVFNFDLTEESCTKENKSGNCLFYKFAFTSHWGTTEFQQVIHLLWELLFSYSAAKLDFRDVVKACKRNLSKPRI